LKVLIIRFSSIGDIVLTTPVIRCIKEQVKDVELHYCTKSSFKGIIESNPFIDKVFTVNDSDKELIQDLKKENYDVIIDLHKNLRSLRVKQALKAKSYSFDKLNIRKFFLVKFKWNIMPAIHIVDRYMKTVEALGVKNDNKGLDYFIPEKDELDLDWYPKNFQSGFIAFAIGGQHQTKRLPLAKMLDLCEQLNTKIVLLGGKEDVQDAEEIESYFKDKTTEILNLVGKINLNQSASVIKKSDSVLTHDTGLMHIASAFKKKVNSIWGNTVPELGMYPYLTEHKIFEVKDLNCRPCSKIGFDSCPKGHFKCMEDLKIDKNEVL